MQNTEGEKKKKKRGRKREDTSYDAFLFSKGNISLTELSFWEIQAEM